MPSNLEELLTGYEKVLIPEMNTGQLIKIIRAEFLIDAKGLNKISGQPFKIREIESAIKEQLESSK
jgi:2-oxoglutarate ferredoxin oxidoreductase subunit alpha